MEICYLIEFHVLYVAKRSGESPGSPERYGVFFMPDEAGECDMDDTLEKQTLMVHGGARRIQYGEVSEAMFLTQGFVYETAKDA